MTIPGIPDFVVSILLGVAAILIAIAYVARRRRNRRTQTGWRSE